MTNEKLIMDYSERKLIDDKTRELSAIYPIEANYCSRCSLWSTGLRDGIVDEDLYKSARNYYGRLWTYVGD